jgi:hypothetical protein
MTIKKTITSIFMIPTLKIDREGLKKNNLINAYIKDEMKDIQYENAVYLLFKPDDLGIFRRFLEDEYARSESVIDDYDYENGYVVVVYKLNPKYKRDFELIKLGSYSLTSTAFQAMFPKVVKIIRDGLHKDEISLQYRIFNRSEDLIKFWEEKLDVNFQDDQEVWGGFFEEDEALNLEKLKELV